MITLCSRPLTKTHHKLTHHWLVWAAESAPKLWLAQKRGLSANQTLQDLSTVLSFWYFSLIVTFNEEWFIVSLLKNTVFTKLLFSIFYVFALTMLSHICNKRTSFSVICPSEWQNNKTGQTCSGFWYDFFLQMRSV